MSGGILPRSKKGERREGLADAIKGINTFQGMS